MALAIHTSTPLGEWIDNPAATVTALRLLKWIKTDTHEDVGVWQ